jgi:chromatin segregation and condensation protein Rec8/ScpA/Scc1 (kleisin family)
MAEKDAENARMAERMKEAKHEAKVNIPKAAEKVLKDDTKRPDTDGKRVTGRKKMAGVSHNGKDDSKKEAEKIHETKEEHDIEEELNAILKRSPSRFRCLVQAQSASSVPRLIHGSHHLLEKLLSTFETSQRHTARKIQDCPRPICRRAGST